MMAAVLIFLFGLAIAYVNGANDVSKGIATLAGSGVTNLRRAIAWGCVWTGAGGIAGALLAKAMIHTFGSGLLASGVHPTVASATAIILGAALWVAMATRKGLPVSTTHAIVGAVMGVSLLAFGIAGMNWSVLTGKVLLPLLASPLLAWILTSVILKISRVFAPSSDCICINLVQPVLAADTPLVVSAPAVHLNTCTAVERKVSGVTINHLHWLTSAATSFSRGMNDVPKMAAVMLGALLVSGKAVKTPFPLFVLIATGMVAGSWLAGRKVTDLLATKITRMDHREGFIANLVTSALVGPGAALGLPMSTTHVASGAILGISAGDHNLNRATVRSMMLAWIITLPGAALLGATALLLLQACGLK